jgi:hypothetical protein
MFLVFFAALGMAAFLHLSRLEFEDFLEQLAILGPFLLLVILKLGLALGYRLRRGGRQKVTDRPLE